MRLAPQPTASTGGGPYIGTVTRVVDDVAYVRIPHLADEYEWPASYGHGVTPAAEWSVVVAFLNDTDEELIILLRLP